MAKFGWKNSWYDYFMVVVLVFCASVWFLAIAYMIEWASQ